MTYLEQVGPSVSLPQHEINLAEAHACASAAWQEFKAYAEDGTEGPSALELSKRLRPRAG